MGPWLGRLRRWEGVEVGAASFLVIETLRHVPSDDGHCIISY